MNNNERIESLLNQVSGASMAAFAGFNKEELCKIASIIVSEKTEAATYSRFEIYKILHVKDTLLEYGKLIRQLLILEMVLRDRACNEGYDDDYYDYECFYWCIFLLFRVGDVNDVKIIWEAKQMDFDASLGVDAEFLLGAGLDKTILFLEQETDEDSKDILEYILECKNEGVFDGMDRWYTFRYEYFL